jgi:hypothetical protein
MPERNYPNLRQSPKHSSGAGKLVRQPLATLTELPGVILAGARKAFSFSYTHATSPAVFISGLIAAFKNRQQAYVTVRRAERQQSYRWQTNR